MNQIKKNKEVLLVCTLFLSANLWILFNHGVFWDDWVWHNNPLETALGVKELGFGPAGSFLIFAFYNDQTIFLSQVLIIVLNLLNAFLINKSLNFYPILLKKEKNLLSAFVLLAPLNSSKFLLCTLNNSINLFFFYTSLFLLLRFPRSYVYKLLAYTLLFLSYFTNSILVFTSVIVAALFFKEMNEQKTCKKTILSVLKSNPVLFILPFIFWIIKSIFFKPSGVYDTYNQITLYSPFYYIIETARAYNQAVITPINYLFKKNIIIYGTIAAIAVTLFFKISQPAKKNSLLKNVSMTIFGILLFFTGTFPYLAVGKTPLFSALVESRHQLLLPLGTAFSLIFALKIVLNFSPRLSDSFIKLIIFVLFPLISFNLLMEYQRMDFKQVAMMHDFKKSLIAEYPKNIVIVDKTEALNFLGYYHRFYDFTGMTALIFGEQNHAIHSNLKSLRTILEFSQEQKKRYKISGSSKSPDYLEVTMVNKSTPPSNLKTFYLLLLRYTNPQEFQKRIENFIIFNYQIKHFDIN